LRGQPLPPLRRRQGSLGAPAGVAGEPRVPRGAARGRAGHRARALRAGGGARPRGAVPHGLGPALAHRAVLHGPPAPDRCAGRVAGARRRRAGGHRLAEHRLDRHGRAPGAQHAAAARHPDRRAPARPRAAARARRPALRGAGEGEALRDLPGARLRDRLSRPTGARRRAFGILCGLPGGAAMTRASALVLLALLAAPAAAQTPALTLAIDATDAPRKLLHAKESLAVAPGPLTLLYPKWIPGEHGPTGPVTDLMGLKIYAGSALLPWRRDLDEMFVV